MAAFPVVSSVPSAALLIALASSLPVIASAQQQADPNFDPRVARPAFTTTHPQVLLDEAHHNFHTASGRYKPFADLLTHDGYHMVPNRQPFTQERLKAASILVIANAMGPPGKRATAAFTEEECAAAEAWVRSGGRLLLIADHYPMGSAAEILSQRFQVAMSKGMTDDPAHYDKALKDILFSQENGLLGDHPITRGRDQQERVNRVVSFTGQSLKGPKGSAVLLKLGETAFDLLPPDKRKVSAAGRAQGAGAALGKGRVVVLGEAGMLTAQLDDKKQPFGMNSPGIDNRQFVLNVMHWLSGLLNEP